MQKPEDALRQSRPLRSPEQIGADTTPSYLPMPAPLVAPIKAKILLAAECSRNGIIYRPVAEAQEFRHVNWLLNRRDYQVGYFDVPLTSIVSLEHKQMAPNASTWRELFGGLVCSDWDGRALAYFESEIGAKPFPATGANGALELYARGGAVQCTNGHHRLIAAVVWLASRFGDTAELRKVRVGYTTVPRQVLQLISTGVQQGKRVDIAEIDDGALIRVSTARTAEFWRKTGEDLEPHRVQRGLAEWYRRRKNPADDEEFGLRWFNVPSSLIAAVADDAWLCEQLARPRYTDKPTH
ncbi:hypothetical protein QHI69_38075 (plasmid) [Burkholderia gladioli pv. gladioli]|uniref:Uncharacterized protein n=1 Tax=Burkholderia gladioli TaxID=28095 RepID=A0AAW3ERT5_BURGA|nr:hypothetical protein [Burkholderia gladioli]AJW93720.1 hypothetical protein BM43_7451 [Burkholderia gladioli]ASD84610.1 hypothetical protein CEJ98_37170 [Burkholderia gladioli pv. gladioli]KGC10551.1 hypothetical protein DM48_6863 [Burkholderia gladioli]MDJ1167727.1 hypothetical protein [Burkholderia gladioli pv. gladioli]QPQ88967.1 hypothetical protein I6H08_36850 [Burkholderia gladioli]